MKKLGLWSLLIILKDVKFKCRENESIKFSHKAWSLSVDFIEKVAIIIILLLFIMLILRTCVSAIFSNLSSLEKLKR